MRATPILNPRPGMGRALPTPVVQSAIVRQVVDLKPAGNTVAIKTVADNPFESRQKVTVVTQASGGMSPAPVSMQSRRLVHQRMAGLGESATGTAPAGESWTNPLLQVIGAAKDIYGAKTAADIAESQRLEQEARARAVEAQSRAAASQSLTDRMLLATTGNVAGFKFNWGLIALGVAGLGAAYFLHQNRKKKKAE